MKIKSITIEKFKRFENLEIANLPKAKLVVVAGPNGCGKSSLFDAMAAWKRVKSGRGGRWDKEYYERSDNQQSDWREQVKIDFHDLTFAPVDPRIKKSIDIRTAYRNDPEFANVRVEKQGDLLDEVRANKLIQTEAATTKNYQRLVSDAFEQVFSTAPEEQTFGAFREEILGQLRSALTNLFPDLRIDTLGNPLVDPTFRFTKGNQSGFDYKNLSGGEKAAFDLILDVVVKKVVYDDTVFVIDEPEAHMNTRVQAQLLTELVRLIPDKSQLWIATHSIGMMRRAKEMWQENPDDIIFLDFGEKDFDQKVAITPTIPDKDFWRRTLNIALDDLSELITPKQVVLCEGNPAGPVAGKNQEHDARCYNIIFGDQYPDSLFVSAGSSKEVVGDRLRFAAFIPKLASGIDIKRLIDRDDHAPTDISEFNRDGIQVLSRRHIEAYLYDSEVLQALYAQHNKSNDYPACEKAVSTAIDDSIKRQNPIDDIKSAAREIYVFLKQDLKLPPSGNDHLAFARNVLAPLIKPGMKVYSELEKSIFGSSQN